MPNSNHNGLADIEGYGDLLSLLCKKSINYMSTAFFQKYGWCEIPKGVLLYRGHSNDSISDVMFFTTKYTPARGFNSRVQVWKTKRKFKVIFLLRNIKHNAFGESALPDLYYEVYPNETNKGLDDLDIKQDHARRNPFAADLSSKFNICGWFTSIEDKVDVELCLFDKNKIDNKLELTQIIENASEIDRYDTLRKFKLLPTESFFNDSKQLIKSRLSWNDEGKEPYKLYRKYINYCVKDYVERGGTAEEGKQVYYDLRSKLRI